MAQANDTIGPYTLVRKLGQGAFGVVWLAERRTKLATTRVAIKLVLDENPDLKAVAHESELWSKAAGHPNVLPIIEADVYEGQVAIVSEYTPDGSLKEWMDRHGRAAPSIDAAVNMTIGILSGLEHLHAQKIIHRDLKPANILLQGETPRLADFGLARFLKSTFNSGSIAGTPSYMAPENFDGKRSEQSDIWAVGVILYQMLSGRLPFPQTEITALVGAIVKRGPEPMPSGIPLGLREVVARALQKEPSTRYQSATEMKAALVKLSREIQLGQKAAFIAPTPIPVQTEEATQASTVYRSAGSAGTTLQPTNPKGTMWGDPQTGVSAYQTIPATVEQNEGFKWKQAVIVLSLLAVAGGSLTYLKMNATPAEISPEKPRSESKVAATSEREQLKDLILQPTDKPKSISTPVEPAKPAKEPTPEAKEVEDYGGPISGEARTTSGKVIDFTGGDRSRSQSGYGTYQQQSSGQSTAQLGGVWKEVEGSCPGSFIRIAMDGGRISAMSGDAYCNNGMKFGWTGYNFQFYDGKYLNYKLRSTSGSPVELYMKIEFISAREGLKYYSSNKSGWTGPERIVKVD